MKIDRHITPEAISVHITNDMAQRGRACFDIAADFSCASGDLIKKIIDSVSLRKVILNDIDYAVINKNLFHDYETEIFNVDFEREESIELLGDYRKCDLIILNPPYSMRGASKYNTNIGTVRIKSSRAMKHILHALRLLSSDGIMYCIIPTNILMSEMDKKIISSLVKSAEITEIKRFGRGHFASASVETVLIRIENYKNAEFCESCKSGVDGESEKSSSFNLTRGNVPIYSLDGCIYTRSGRNRVPFVHTTNIDTNKAFFINRNTKYRVFSGRFILLPRIGRPTLRKIKIYEGELAVSDCVIVIQGEMIDLLHWYLINNYVKLEAIYSGHCAKYTTISRLNKLLFNFEVEISNNERASERSIVQSVI